GCPRELDAAAGLGDAALRLAFQQEVLEVGKEALHFLAATAIDKPERRVGDGDPIRRVYRIEKLLSRTAQLIVGFFDNRLVIPHRIVTRAALLAFFIELGEPTARPRRTLDTGEQSTDGRMHRRLIEIAGFNQVRLA